MRSSRPTSARIPRRTSAIKPLAFIAAAVISGLLFSPPAIADPPANQLRNHPSAYLSLHASDPVAWQEWSPAVLARAKRERKLVLLSIGYFSCYWCHVMQRESFRDAGIADFLNSHFVPVKIDREIEPALDARLMDFAQSTRGRAGWPLNVFLTPSGAPLYATFYLPANDFREALVRLEALWREDEARLMQLAENAAPMPRGPGRSVIDVERIRENEERLRAVLRAQADVVHGGFGEQGKFPSVPQLEFLLGAPDPGTREFLVTTLDQMAANGLQDQLGGGFFRYTTDPAWKSPHFEKMLYDNAQLARLYLRAGRVLNRKDYREIGLRTVDFMLREMRHADGGFIAALSAVDGHGREGGYYLWDQSTLAAILNAQQLAVYRLATGMTDAPAFDGGFLPVSGLAPDEIAKRLQLSHEEVVAQLEASRRRLIDARSQRVLPRDTKRVAAWNGLALMTLVEAARNAADPRYLAAASDVARMLSTRHWDGSALHRALADGKRIGRAAAEDYAYVGQGLLVFAQLTGETKDYLLAERIVRAGWRKFYVTVNGTPGWRLSENDLLGSIARQDLLPDGPMSSPSAVLIESSLLLAERRQDTAFRKRALGALNADDSDLRDDPFWFATQVVVMRRAALSKEVNGSASSIPTAPADPAG